MSNLVERAARFAAAAHEGQKRNYTGEPYYTHLVAVAHRVALAPDADEATVAAAYLHDTLEDTPATYAQLVSEFGAEVADLVVEVTNVYTSKVYPHLDRTTRKALEAERLATISDRAKLIKRADIAHNTETIARHDPAFAADYLPEKARVLRLMDQK